MIDSRCAGGGAERVRLAGGVRLGGAHIGHKVPHRHKPEAHDHGIARRVNELVDGPRIKALSQVDFDLPG